MNTMQIDHPTWFVVVSLTLYVPVACAGALAGRRP
jgi:hypothetical protein